LVDLEERLEYSEQRENLLALELAKHQSGNVSTGLNLFTDSTEKDQLQKQLQESAALAEEDRRQIDLLSGVCARLHTRSQGSLRVGVYRVCAHAFKDVLRMIAVSCKYIMHLWAFTSYKPALLLLTILSDRTIG
jgi:hypothetical protein